MTAEIVVMNQNGVALAADSAVTARTATGTKIYNSANKLFALSKRNPVAVMIYGGAKFIGTPWEVIIKCYRQQLGEQLFDTLQEYANDFMSFVSKNKVIIKAEQKEQYVKDAIYSLMEEVRVGILSELEEIAKAKGTVTLDEIKSVTSEQLKSHVETFVLRPYVSGCNSRTEQAFLKKYSSLTNEAIKEVFEKLPLSRNDLGKIRKIVVNFFLREVFTTSTSGIVFAGFGDKEAFPSSIDYLVEGAFLSKLKISRGAISTIDYRKNVVIRPFAQDEMVYTFMEGIDPQHQDTIRMFMDSIEETAPSIFIDELNVTDENIKRKIKSSFSNMFGKVKTALRDYRQKNHVQPIVNAVGLLPIDELAAMAESLVHLTSMKRRVSMDDETVGGAIDVAVITKGDGLIWIKRKHYFKPELNHQFFSNYYAK